MKHTICLLGCLKCTFAFDELIFYAGNAVTENSALHSQRSLRMRMPMGLVRVLATYQRVMKLLMDINCVFNWPCTSQEEKVRLSEKSENGRIS